MTGEIVPKASEAPKMCHLAHVCGELALVEMQEYRNALFCAERPCQLLGKDVNIHYGIGQATLTVKHDTQGRTGAPGCPTEKIVTFGPAVPPGSEGRNYRT
jgi:hypothetical protein